MTAAQRAKCEAMSDAELEEYLGVEDAKESIRKQGLARTDYVEMHDPDVQARYGRYWDLARAAVKA